MRHFDNLQTLWLKTELKRNCVKNLKRNNLGTFPKTRAKHWHLSQWTSKYVWIFAHKISKEVEFECLFVFSFGLLMSSPVITAVWHASHSTKPGANMLIKALYANFKPQGFYQSLHISFLREFRACQKDPCLMTIQSLTKNIWA